MDTTNGMQAADIMQQQAQGAPPPQAPPQQRQQQQQPMPTQGATDDQMLQYVQPAEKRGGMAGLLDVVADALAGHNGPDKVTIGADGSRQVTPGEPQSRGKQWAKIGLEALQGATTAAAAPPGPGHTAQGVAGAVGQQIAQARQENAKAEAQANEDYQRQQQAQMQKINYQILSRRLISQALTDHNNQVKASQEQVDFSNRQIDREKTLGSVDLGFVTGSGSIADLGNKDPDLIKDYHDGLITVWPVYNQKGDSVGMQVFRRKPDVNAQEYSGVIHKFVPPADGKPAQLTTYTPAKGSLTNGQATNLDASEITKYNDWQKKTTDVSKTNAEINKDKAQTTQAYAAAGKDRAQAEALKGAVSDDQTSTIAAGVFDGSEDPTQLSKRSKSYDAVVAKLNKMQQAATGENFPMAKASSDYKFATNPNTQSTLKYLNSLTGSNGQEGNLDLVVRMSKDKKLALGEYPALNNIAQWAKLESGNPQVAAYRAALVETQDQIAKILQGGGTGSGTSDAKLKQAGDLLQKGFTPEQIASVAGNALKPMLGNRKREMIGDNIYLTRWYGPKQQSAAQQQPQQGGHQPAPQGAAVQPEKVQPGEPTAKASDGGILVVRGGKWVPAQQ